MALKQVFYIAVEGIDGAGKTTQARIIADKLRHRGMRVMLVHEPTDGKIGRLIKDALRGRVKVSEEVLALLFAADRLVLREKILAAKDRGVFVVSDRSVVSSLAYQSVAVGRSRWVYEVNRFAAKPDIVVYLSISPETAVKRLGKNLQRYERKTFLTRVGEAYRRVLRRFRRVVVVDGEMPVETVSQQIFEGLAQFIPSLRK